MKPQRPLFDAPLRELTERQAAIYALACSVPGGVSADELGALMHSRLADPVRRHSADDRCLFCGRDGARALREKAIRERLIRRAGALYEPRDPADRAADEPVEGAIDWNNGGSIPF